MSFKSVICLDFDGVIHSYTSGWEGADVVSDGPVHGAMAAILEYQAAGFEVAVYSSRSSSAHIGGIQAMRSAIFQWMHAHILEIHGTENMKLVTKATDAIVYPREKPAAFVTIDDRGIQFKGVWPSAKEIEDFKPWYK
jgi:hypothetical protein